MAKCAVCGCLIDSRNKTCSKRCMGKLLSDMQEAIAYDRQPGDPTPEEIAAACRKIRDSRIVDDKLRKEPDHKVKNYTTRTCLKCRRKFPSEGVENQLCKECQHSNQFVTGIRQCELNFERTFSRSES